MGTNDSSEAMMLRRLALGDELPDHDNIPSIKPGTGVYSLDRWPERVCDLIAFLQKVADRFGPNSEISVAGPYDGYPGYIQVRSEAEILAETLARQAYESAVKSGMSKLTEEEKRALRL